MSLNRLHITQLYLITSGPCQTEPYDSRPGRESVSQWGQHRSVYNTIKYSKHVSLRWTRGIVWHLCFQKASWGQRSNEIECGTAVSTFSTSKADPTFCSSQMSTLWSLKQGTRGSLWTGPSLSREMMKPVHWAGLKLGGLMDHRLRLVFRQVPQNICLYFFGTKPDIWVHLTYREVRSFTIWAHPGRHWVIAGFRLVLWRSVMEKNVFLEIRIRVFHHREMFSAWSWLLQEGVNSWDLPYFSRWIPQWLPLYHSPFLLTASPFIPTTEKKWFQSAATEGQHCQAVNQ